MDNTIEKDNIDLQVTFAKQYKRNLTSSIENSISLATMSQETARSCAYALIRDGKVITGPTIHLAKIIASCWGNIYTEAKVIRRTDKEIISRGYCWDLETNASASFEISRSIIDSRGNQFPEDIIVASGNAANSISFRNAVFAVIPKSITDKVYLEAQKCVTGDLSNDSNLIKSRNDIIKKFKSYKITETEIIKLCTRQTIEQINTDEIYTLICILQSLKDGDTTVSDLMKPIRSRKEEVTEKKKTIKRKKAPELP